jgi:NAD(P)H-dependent flavin oxidoreductase YrpB (nitropropane dioxygenase family)
VRTELAERLGIEFPIFAFTHCRDVAAAVSNAGGFGVLGAIGFSAEQLEVELTWLDEHVPRPPTTASTSSSPASTRAWASWTR